MKAHFKKIYILIGIFFNGVLFAQTPDFTLTGFASENGGTTGGLGGREVIVNNYDSLKFYALSTSPYVIYVSGTIHGKSTVANNNYQGQINVASNKSILGLGNNAFLDGVGIAIVATKNIIIKNIKFSLISVAKQIPQGSPDIAKVYSALGDANRPQILVNGGDLISIGGTCANIWIDHCEFYQENPRIQSNQDLYDGLIDVKGAASYITISWCYFHDHHKCSLIGSSDTDAPADRKITFHHNYFKTITERVPLLRGGSAHFYNNYCNDVYSGVVNTRVNACVKVEKNYYESCRNPVYSKDSKICGLADTLDNKTVNCIYTLQSFPGCTKPTTSITSIPDACVAVIPYSYSGSLTPTEDVKETVMNFAGVGKVPLGLEDIIFADHTETVSAGPNPFVQSITINNPSSFIYNVYNTSGVLIDNGISNGSVSIGSDFAKGLYLVKIVSEIKTSVLKIEKK